MAEEKNAEGKEPVGQAPVRKWYPAEYVDEVCPSGLDSPLAWLRPIGDGYYTLKSPYHDAPEEEAERWVFHPMKEGTIIPFMWCDEFEDVSISITRQGNFFVMPGSSIHKNAAQFFLAGDPDSLAFHMEDFVEWYIKEHGKPDKNTRVDVRQARWAVEEIKFVFDMKDGKPTLTEAGTA